jgi:hypothetical protein
MAMFNPFSRSSSLPCSSLVFPFPLPLPTHRCCLVGGECVLCQKHTHPQVREAAASGARVLVRAPTYRHRIQWPVFQRQFGPPEARGVESGLAYRPDVYQRR